MSFTPTLFENNSLHALQAEFGRFPLQKQSWQCIQNTDNTRLVTLAMLEGFSFSEQGIAFNDVCPLRRQHLSLFLQPHTMNFLMNLYIAAIVENAKQLYVEQ